MTSPRHPLRTPEFLLPAALLTAVTALLLPYSALVPQAALLVLVAAAGLGLHVHWGHVLLRLLPLLSLAVAFTAILLGLSHVGRMGPVEQAAAWRGMVVLLSKSGWVVLIFGVAGQSFSLSEALGAMQNLRFPRLLRTVVYLAWYWCGDLARRARALCRALACRGPLRGLRRWQVTGQVARTLMETTLGRADLLACALHARGFQGYLVVIAPPVNHALVLPALLVWMLILGAVCTWALW
jgi:hypothetical protein